MRTINFDLEEAYRNLLKEAEIAVRMLKSSDSIVANDCYVSQGLYSSILSYEKENLRLNNTGY